MYVEEVCIDGFKSYAQRTVVPAFDPLGSEKYVLER